jgi:hypothetical protein
LEEPVAAFKLLVLILDDFYAIDYVHEAGLQRFRLPALLVSGMLERLGGQSVASETMHSTHDLIDAEAQ